MLKSIRHRIAIFAGLSSLVALFAGVTLSLRIYENVVHRQQAQELQRLSNSITVSIDKRAESLLHIAPELVCNNTILGAILTRDFRQIELTVERFLQTHQLEFAEIIDTAGGILHCSSDLQEIGHTTTSSCVSLVKPPDKKIYGLLAYHESLYLAAILPIQIDNRTIGAITLGDQVDSALTHQLAGGQNERYAFWIGSQRRSRTSGLESGLAPLSDLLSPAELDQVACGATITKSISLDNDPYEAAVYSLPTLNSTEPIYGAIYRSMAFLRDAGNAARLNLIGVAAALTLIMFFFIVWLTRRLTEPLTKLAVATRRLSHLDFSTRLEVSGVDEVNTVAASFNTLSDALQRSLAQKDDFAEELRQLNQNLERQVALRTEELLRTNQKLQREMADKEDFLRAVSHDLGAPLRNIAGLARLIERRYKQQLGETAHDMLDRIANNVKNELALIEQLLELSRIKTRRGQSGEAPLRKIVAEVQADLSYSLAEKHVRLICPDDLPVIWGERHRLRQLFQNLIDNAVKYMGAQAEPQIEIGWVPLPASVMFWVSDNGIGIPEDQKDKVFGVFRRVNVKEVRSVEGKGIGLASVKTIVQMYGGEIWVESELGQGSTFYFTIDNSLVFPTSRDRRESEPEKNHWRRPYDTSIID